MSTLYTFGRCQTPFGHIDLESYLGPEYAHATFYRTDGSDELLTMSQIGAIIATGIGQPWEDSFEEVEDETYGLNDVPSERILTALMLLQAELFQQKYERL